MVYFLKGPLDALSQSCVCARCALARCLVLLATLESSWLLSAHQPATGRQSHRPASRERPDSTDRVSCRCLLFSRRCSSASGSAAHPSHTPPRPS